MAVNDSVEWQRRPGLIPPLVKVTDATSMLVFVARDTGRADDGGGAVWTAPSGELQALR